jgi:hypothetical protein
LRLAPHLIEGGLSLPDIFSPKKYGSTKILNNILFYELIKNNAIARLKHPLAFGACAGRHSWRQGIARKAYE